MTSATKPILTGGCQLRRYPLCAVGGAGEGQHLSLPDVPEGVRRTVRVFRRR